MVLIMSVNPGFGGQEFIPASIEKIRYINEMKNSGNLNFDIEVDGGVYANDVGRLTAAGVNIIVAGYSIFGGGNIKANMEAFFK